ncbi:MAG: response regulator transcription factor [Deltaproteobacteria bacterium]|nr:response regulator transcription factor [Deltaproteobacteria bacterium]
MATILLVDDDVSLVEMLTMALERAGFVVRSAHDGAAAWALFQKAAPDVAILDVLMPELDGLTLCRQIRSSSSTPVILLTSRDEELDQILGLEMGADDYISKPCSTRLLIARVEALLRRAGRRGPHPTSGPGAAQTHAQPRTPGQAQPNTVERLSVGILSIDRYSHEAYVGTSRLRLTVTEFELLYVLMRFADQVLSRDAIIDAVYGADVFVSDRTIDTFVKRLRRKLSEGTQPFDGIETVRGVGYRLRS